MQAFRITVGGRIDLVGEDNVRTFLEEKAAAASCKADCEYDRDNVIACRMQLLTFALLFALLSIVTLEFIDEDRR